MLKLHFWQARVMFATPVRSILSMKHEDIYSGISKVTHRNLHYVSLYMYEVFMSYYTTIATTLLSSHLSFNKMTQHVHEFNLAANEG